MSKLSRSQQIQLLTQAHKFFSEFSRVSGKEAHKYAIALDAIGLVCNTLRADAKHHEQSSASAINHQEPIHPPIPSSSTSKSDEKHREENLQDDQIV